MHAKGQELLIHPIHVGVGFRATTYRITVMTHQSARFNQSPSVSWRWAGYGPVEPFGLAIVTNL